MRKLSISIILVLLLISPLDAFAKNYEVNPFYALRSYPEYEKVRELLGDSNNMYYGWSRIARDSDGNMVFTDSRISLSKYDIYSSDYAIPETVDGKLTNEINKSLHPGSEGLMMVFFNKITYDDGRNSIIDFLNMSRDDWDRYIIEPIIDSINAYGFDGVVLDIEGISDSYVDADYTDGQNSGLKGKYNDFLSRLKAGLGNKKLVVSVNMPEFGGYDYSYIYNIADHILLLAYPYQHYSTYGQEDEVPDLMGKIKGIDIPEAVPYGKIKADLDRITDILKKEYGTSYNSERIILGTTIEITGWIEKEYVYQSRTYTYYERTNSLEKGNKFRISTLEDIEDLDAPEEYIGISPVYKYESRTNIKVLTTGLDSGMKRVEYYYEAPETIYEKYYKLVSDYSLGGISLWRMGLGDYRQEDSIWNSLNDMFGIHKEDFEELSYRTDVAVDKAWTVKFSRSLNEDTIKSAKDNIAIVDAYGNLLEVDYSYDSRANSVKVSPLADYKSGKLYYLIIGKNIRSEGGASLSKPVVMRFKVK